MVWASDGGDGALVNEHLSRRGCRRWEAAFLFILCSPVVSLLLDVFLSTMYLVWPSIVSSSVMLVALFLNPGENLFRRGGWNE